MTPIALVFLILSIGIIWGGLALSIINLRKNPEIPEEEETHQNQ